MNKTFISLCVTGIVAAGYGWSWTATETPHFATSVVTAQESAAAAAELRHKHAEPSHWRALLLRQ